MLRASHHFRQRNVWSRAVRTLATSISDVEEQRKDFHLQLTSQQQQQQQQRQRRIVPFSHHQPPSFIDVPATADITSQLRHERLCLSSGIVLDYASTVNAHHLQSQQPFFHPDHHHRRRRRRRRPSSISSSSSSSSFKRSFHTTSRRWSPDKQTRDGSSTAQGVTPTTTKRTASTPRWLQEEETPTSVTIKRMIVALPGQVWRVTKRLLKWIFKCLRNPSHFKETMSEFWTHIKHDFQRYKTGTQLLIADIKLATNILQRVLRGYSLSRRERNQLKRTALDILRVGPLAMFIIVPGMEFVLPFAVKAFPNMLPSTFRETLKTQEGECSCCAIVFVLCNIDTGQSYICSLVHALTFSLIFLSFSLFFSFLLFSSLFSL